MNAETENEQKRRGRHLQHSLIRWIGRSHRSILLMSCWKRQVYSKESPGWSKSATISWRCSVLTILCVTTILRYGFPYFPSPQRSLETRTGSCCLFCITQMSDPTSGRYQKNADGSVPPIEWKIRYVCLSSSEVRLINRLPDVDQTPTDIDVVMNNAGDWAVGNQFSRATNRARWKLNPELMKAVEQEAIEMSTGFAANVAHLPGITIFDNFEAAQAALFPTRSGSYQKDICH